MPLRIFFRRRRMNSKTARQQIIAFAGDGRLRDGTAASAEFREYVELI